MLENTLVKDMGITESDVFIEYVKKRSPIYPSVEWRITILNENLQQETTIGPTQSTTLMPETTTAGTKSFTLAIGVLIMSLLITLRGF